MPRSVWRVILLCAPLGDDSPDEENDESADDGADEPRTLTGRIPPERLPEIARNDCSHDAEDCRQHETRGLVAARHDELSDHASDKPNDDRPDDTHRLLLRGSSTAELSHNDTPLQSYRGNCTLVPEIVRWRRCVPLRT